VVAVAPVATVVRSTVSAPASAAGAAGEESSKERVELCDPLLGDIDGDLLVIRGSWA
jgi:uncharacterized membrane protein